MTDKEALKLALKALEHSHANEPIWKTPHREAITAIKEALAQPDAFEQGRQEGMKQERALWELSKLGQEIEACQYAVDVAMPEYRCVGKCQYAAPPQRPWVGLTDEERSEIFNRMDWVIDFNWEYELAIEAKLKERNT